MKKKYVLIILATGLLLTSGFILTPKPAFADTSVWLKGANIEPRGDTDFSSETFKQSVLNLSKTNANYVTLVIPYYQSNLYSTDIQKRWNTPSDASLADAVQYIHSLGMKVMFKIHLNSYSNEWRADINPSDRDTWFGNYNSILTHYATIAQQSRVEAYCIGTELISMAAENQNNDNTQRWRTMIAGVRKLYSGQLTYSANWGPPNDGFVDEKNHIQFWDALDFIGMSAYYEMFTDNSVQSLFNAWGNYNTSDVQALAQKWKKPIVFTEIGYKAVSNSFNHPWDFTFGGSYDEDTQANAYQALFSFWSSQSIMKGVLLWSWSSDPNYGGQGNTDYTPQNKKAQAVMTQWFALGSSPKANPLPKASASTPTSSSLTVVRPGPASYASGSLVLDQGTVYLILGGSKLGFASVKALTGLGYTLKSLVKGDTSAYALSRVVLASPIQTHPAGSWIIQNRTVYYVSSSGLIPVPSWEVFLSNGGAAKYLLKANQADLKQARLDMMVMSDSRVR